MMSKTEGEGLNLFLFHLARQRFMLFRKVHHNNQYPKTINLLNAKIEAINKLEQTEKIISLLDRQHREQLESIANDHFLNPYKNF